MSDLIKIFSSDNFTMSSSWTEVLYCSFEDDGTILIIEHKDGDGAEEWYETAVDVSKPADFIEAINSLENITFDCINTVIASLEDNNHQFASVLKEELLLQEALEEPLQPKPSMASDASVTDTEAAALKLAGIENGVFDQNSKPQVHPTNPDNPPKVLAKRKAPIKKTRVKRRAVFVVVTDWPSGTMARKFGDVMQAALDISKDGMNLVQMAPERIFRVETTVSEAEFREVMRARDVASGGNMLFVEIPNT